MTINGIAARHRPRTADREVGRGVGVLHLVDVGDDDVERVGGVAAWQLGHVPRPGDVQHLHAGRPPATPRPSRYARRAACTAAGSCRAKEVSMPPAMIVSAIDTFNALPISWRPNYVMGKSK
jgi:hypothetical protein